MAEPFQKRILKSAKLTADYIRPVKSSHSLTIGLTSTGTSVCSGDCRRLPYTVHYGNQERGTRKDNNKKRTQKTTHTHVYIWWMLKFFNCPAMRYWPVDNRDRVDWSAEAVMLWEHLWLFGGSVCDCCMMDRINAICLLPMGGPLKSVRIRSSHRNKKLREKKGSVRKRTFYNIVVLLLQRLILDNNKASIILT